MARVDYEPAESRTGLFGGNSNWRGPVWFPLNHLVVQGLRRLHAYLRGRASPSSARSARAGSSTSARSPTRSALRLVAIFRDAGGRRPVFGSNELFQRDPAWHDLLLFHEYFHGDNGTGLGASHQTGWTGLVADMLAAR